MSYNKVSKHFGSSGGVSPCVLCVPNVLRIESKKKIKIKKGEQYKKEKRELISEEEKGAKGSFSPSSPFNKKKKREKKKKEAGSFIDGKLWKKCDHRRGRPHTI